MGVDAKIGIYVNRRHGCGSESRACFEALAKITMFIYHHIRLFRCELVEFRHNLKNGTRLPERNRQQRVLASSPWSTTGFAGSQCS